MEMRVSGALSIAAFSIARARFLPFFLPFRGRRPLVLIFHERR
jgi:hypothetical protein